ncbi:MAG: molybdenum cofactor biosynthesis protein MoaE [Gammaproteobacteria bacterium]
MQVELRSAAFDPFAEIDAYQKQRLAPGKYGATGIFIGSLRDFSGDATVESLYLEHYPEMTQEHLQQICAGATEKWSLIDGLVLHRVGQVEMAEAIVLVAVWAAHRGDAMDACRFIIEDLKHSAPFWKKERLQEGTRWVENNTDGYTR